VTYSLSRAAEVVTCPVCGFAATGTEFNSGWMVRTVMGTYVGNWRDSKPPAGLGGEVERCEFEDRLELLPCRHRVSGRSGLELQPDPESDHRAYPADLPTRFPVDFETTCGTCERKIRLVGVSSERVEFTHYGYGS
jgi:hypothetical protein